LLLLLLLLLLAYELTHAQWKCRFGFISRTAFGFPHVRNETRDDVIKIKHNQSRNSFKALRIRNNFDDKPNRQTDK